MAAVRPEFRADVLVFDPRDPVFGGPPCAGGRVRVARTAAGTVPGAPAAVAGGREARPGRVPSGQPSLDGHGRCRWPVPGRRLRFRACSAQGLCARHVQPVEEGRAARPGRVAGRAPGRRMPEPPPDCLISYCELWAQRDVGAVPGPRKRWREHGRPDPGEFAAVLRGDPRSRPGHIDLRRCPRS